MSHRRAGKCLFFLASFCIITLLYNEKRTSFHVIKIRHELRHQPRDIQDNLEFKYKIKNLAKITNTTQPTKTKTYVFQNKHNQTNSPSPHPTEALISPNTPLYRDTAGGFRQVCGHLDIWVYSAYFLYPDHQHTKPWIKAICLASANETVRDLSIQPTCHLKLTNGQVVTSQGRQVHVGPSMWFMKR